MLIVLTLLQPPPRQFIEAACVFLYSFGIGGSGFLGSRTEVPGLQSLGFKGLRVFRVFRVFRIFGVTIALGFRVSMLRSRAATLRR